MNDQDNKISKNPLRKVEDPDPTKTKEMSLDEFYWHLGTMGVYEDCEKIAETLMASRQFIDNHVIDRRQFLKEAISCAEDHPHVHTQRLYGIAVYQHVDEHAAKALVKSFENNIQDYMDRGIRFVENDKKTDYHKQIDGESLYNRDAIMLGRLFYEKVEHFLKETVSANFTAEMIFDENKKETLSNAIGFDFVNTDGHRVLNTHKI